MEESILNHKSVLVVDDEPDVLNVLEEEILEVAPHCKFSKATTYEEAVRMMESQHHDLVILDIMGVRGFDLLEMGVKQNFKVVMLTAHALNPESLRRSIEKGARAYLPKDKLGEMVPFMEDILAESDPLSGWVHLMKKLEGFFNDRWGEQWQMKEEKYWKEFYKKTLHIKL